MSRIRTLLSAITSDQLEYVKYCSESSAFLFKLQSEIKTLRGVTVDSLLVYMRIPSNTSFYTSVWDPDPQDPHFLGLRDPDPFVRGTDPDPSLFP